MEVAAGHVNEPEIHPAAALPPRKDSYVSRVAAIKNELQPNHLLLKNKRQQRSLISLSEFKNLDPEASKSTERHHAPAKDARALLLKATSLSDPRKPSHAPVPTSPRTKPISSPKVAPSKEAAKRPKSVPNEPPVHLSVVPSQTGTPGTHANANPSAKAPVPFTAKSNSRPTETSSPPASAIQNVTPSQNPEKVQLMISSFTTKQAVSIQDSVPPPSTSASIGPEANLMKQKSEAPSSARSKFPEKYRITVPHSKGSTGIVLPLRCLISKRYKVKSAEKPPEEQDTTKRSRAASADSAVQTEKTFIPIPPRPLSSLETHIDGRARATLLSYLKHTNERRKLLKNADLNSPEPTNTLYPLATFTATPFLGNLEKNSYSTSQLASTRLHSLADYFFEKSNFAKSSSKDWEKQRTIQSILSKDLDEQCRRAIASAEVKKRSRHATVSHAPSSPRPHARRRTVSAPAHTSLERTSLPKPASKIPSFSNSADPNLSFGFLHMKSVGAHRARPLMRRRRIFKRPHHFALIPKVFDGSTYLLEPPFKHAASPESQLKTVLLQFGPEPPTSSITKKRKPLGHRQLQNSLLSSSRLIDTIVNIPHSEPISLSTTIKQYYYVTQPSAPPPRKSICVPTVKPAILPTPRVSMPSWVQPVLSFPKEKRVQRKKAVKQEDKTRVSRNDSVKMPKLEEKEESLEELLPIYEEIVQEPLVNKDDIAAKEMTETLIPKITSFNKSQRVMFLQDFSRLSKWFEDITTKNFVNNNPYSLEVDTRKIEEFTENDFHRMVWNLYYYVILLGQEMFMPKKFYNAIYELLLSNTEDVLKAEQCRLLIDSLPKGAYLNVKSVIGHSFRLSKVAMGNSAFLGILYTTVGHVLFPGIRLPTPPEEAAPTRTLPTALALLQSRRTSVGAASSSYSPFDAFAAMGRRASVVPPNLFGERRSSVSPLLMHASSLDESSDSLNASLRVPINTEMEEVRLNEVKSVTATVVSAALQGKSIKQQLPPGGLTFMYLVELFETLF